jgi:hypothetical protein
MANFRAGKRMVEVGRALMSASAAVLDKQPTADSAGAKVCQHLPESRDWASGRYGNLLDYCFECGKVLGPHKVLPIPASAEAEEEACGWTPATRHLHLVNEMVMADQIRSLEARLQAVEGGSGRPRIMDLSTADSHSDAEPCPTWGATKNPLEQATPAEVAAFSTEPTAPPTPPGPPQQSATFPTLLCPTCGQSMVAKVGTEPTLELTI